MKKRRKVGRRLFRGWVLTLIWFALAAGILINAFGSHRSFKYSITKIFNEDQVLNVHLLQQMIFDHVDEAKQALSHGVSMVRRQGSAEPDFANTLGMIYRDHTDDFLSVSVVSPLGELLYHTRGESGANPMEVAIVDKVTIHPSAETVVSERVLSPDGEPSTFLILPFQLREGGETYFLFGELRLKTFLSAGMKGFQGEFFSFVVADYMGEIYYIANMSHQKRDLMEKGDIFPLEGVCLDCHGESDFSDLAEAVESGGPVHAVFRSPRGRLVNRTSALFPILNEKWLVSISVPYDVLQGQIDKNFNRNAASALLLLLLTGSGSLLLYVINRQRALEDEYYNIVDSIDVGLCRIDDSGRILSANPAMEKILGRKGSEIEWEDLNGFCADGYRIRQCVSGLTKENPAANCEIQMVRGDGASFEAQVAAKRNPGNHIDLAITDVTARKTAEAALRKAKEELEEQNEELKKVDRIKEALIGDVSHELKTPVAKQIMNLDILTHIHEQVGIKDKTEDIVASMVNNLRRQQSVIKNILLTSRLESGGRKFRFDAVRLDKLVEDVVNEHLHSLSAHGIHLEQHLVEAVVGADEEMLWHVFANVLDNAIKYRREEEPRIKVAMETKGAEVVVRITDNGKGLSEEELKKAFERFYQSATSTDGIGLGLYICLTMLERMGGWIDLKSEGPGRGTTAEIGLPLG